MLRQPRPLVPFTFPFAGQSYLQRILNTQKASLLALWGLSETTGTSAADSSGNGFTGTYVNGVTLNAATFSDGTPAPSFDGTDDYVNVYASGLSSAWNPNEGTFALWVAFDGTLLASTSPARLVSLMGASNANGIRPFKTSAANSLVFRRTQGGADKDIAFTLSTSAWTHLALTWSATANLMTGYVNGVSVGTNTAPTISVSGLGAATTVLGTTNTTPPVQLYKGYMKYAALWATPLSASEISTLAAI